VSLEQSCIVLFGIALLGVAGFYAWRQIRTLRQLPLLSEADRRFSRRQAYRRLVGCALAVACVLCLMGAFSLADATSELAAEGAAARARDERPQLDENQRALLNRYGAYWIGAMLFLMVWLLTAAIDWWETRRFGLQQRQQIRDDTRAEIEVEVARLRRERNGRH
jgi:hypothetical protein